MLDGSLDIAEALLVQTWRVRLNEPLYLTEGVLKTLSDQMKYIQENEPPIVTNNPRFLRLLAQVKRLEAVIHVEKKEYTQALESFQAMLQIADELGESVTLALAHIGIGVELDRIRKSNESLDSLEYARDLTFDTSKNLAAMANAYLARAYATNQDSKSFERAIDTALRLTHSMPDDYMDITENAFISSSFVLDEQASGLIKLNRASESQAVLSDLERQIQLEGNKFKRVHLAIHKSRTHLLKGEIEASTEEARSYFEQCILYKSPHMLQKAVELIAELKQAGYKAVTAVRGLEQDILDYLNQNP